MRKLTRLMRSLGVVDVVPALALAIYGTVWIILHVSARGETHTAFQSLALAESVVAVLLVRRKPLGSLLGILVFYLLVDLEPLMLPPALFALATLAAIGSRRAALFGAGASAAVFQLMPLVHGDPVSIIDALWHLAAVVVSVVAGLVVGSRGQANMQSQGGDA